MKRFLRFPQFKTVTFCSNAHAGPKGKPRALRFPAEIEDRLLELEDWQAFLIDAVQQKLNRED